MQTSTNGEIDALVTPHVITMARRPDSESSPRSRRRTQGDDIEERLKDTVGLFALEMVERQSTEKE